MWVLLLAFAIFNIGRYLPSAGGRDHSQSDFLWKVLAPLAGAILCFMIYDSLLFGVSEGNLTRARGAILWVLFPCAAGWLVFLLFCVRSMKRRLKLLFGPLSLALLLVAGCMDAVTWVITNIELPGWAVLRDDCSASPALGVRPGRHDLCRFVEHCSGGR